MGINLTHMAYKLLIDGSAKTHMFNVCASSPVESERRPILKVIRDKKVVLMGFSNKYFRSEKASY